MILRVAISSPFFAYHQEHEYMELLFIIAAFVMGFIALKINLPPLVGFLLAGFGLHALGFQSNDALETFADLGVTLLLFPLA